MDLLRVKRRVRKQALAQVGQVAIGVFRWRDTFVNLRHVHARPWHIFTCQSAQHLPWSVAATHRHNEASACRYRRARFGSDDLGSLTRDRTGVCKYFNLHSNSRLGLEYWTNGVMHLALP